MSDNLNVSEMSGEDRRRYQHLSVLVAAKELLKVSHVPLLRYEGSRVARVTVVLADVPGSKHSREIDFSPCDSLYTDRNGNLSLKAENAAVENTEENRCKLASEIVDNWDMKQLKEYAHDCLNRQYERFPSDLENDWEWIFGDEEEDDDA